MKAQEMSKVLVLNGTPVPNANSRPKEGVEIDEPFFQENYAMMIDP